MLELGGRAGLTLEPLDELGIEREGEREHLDGDFALQLPVPGPIDQSHPAPPEFLDDLVLGGERLAHEIGLLERARGDGMHGRRRHEIETAGWAELGFAGDFAAATGAEHARKLPCPPR